MRRLRVTRCEDVWPAPKIGGARAGIPADPPPKHCQSPPALQVPDAPSGCPLRLPLAPYACPQDFPDGAAPECTPRSVRDAHLPPITISAPGPPPRRTCAPSPCQLSEADVRPHGDCVPPPRLRAPTNELPPVRPRFVACWLIGFMRRPVANYSPRAFAPGSDPSVLSPT